MNNTQRAHFRADKVLYLPPPCQFCGEKEGSGIQGGSRLYSLEIVREAPLIILFGVLADGFGDIGFTRHQIMKFVEKERSWFEWGMKTHLFMGEGEVFSVRRGEDNLYHFETHDIFCVSEMWRGDRGHRLYVPDYIIG